MFTGIVEEQGTIRSLTRQGPGVRIEIASSLVLGDATIGASIAVNGCCLTVVELGNDSWTAEAVPETLERTTLGTLAVGDPVNLERPMAADGRFGGHIVQGHVDAITTVRSVDPLDDGSRRLTLDLPENLAGYIVEKGSVTLDGISLTVASVAADSFDIAVIPHTLEVTTLAQRPVGAALNLEADCIAKYVERLIVTGRVDAVASQETHS